MFHLLSGSCTGAESSWEEDSSPLMSAEMKQWLNTRYCDENSAMPLSGIRLIETKLTVMKRRLIATWEDKDSHTSSVEE